MNNKEKLINYLNQEGKTESWENLAKQFDFKNGEAARSIWKNYRKQNDIISTDYQREAKVSKLKRWQLPNGEWRESVTYESSKDKMIVFNDFKKQFIKEVEKLSPIVLKEHVNENKEILAEISLPDFHLGKMTGETLEQQEQLFYDSISNLLSYLGNYKIDRFLLPIGNDIINSEGATRATTKGTPQQDNAEWQDLFTVAWRMVTNVVNIISDIAPVDIIIISGNHSYATEFYLGETLKAYYTNNQNVSVDNNKHPRKYYGYGKTLLGFTHGDSEKPHELPLIMATEVPVEFSKATFREWHLGHIHKMMADEFRGIQVKFLPSICGEDSWHKRMGYHAQRKAQCLLFHKETGPFGFFQINK